MAFEHTCRHACRSIAHEALHLLPRTGCSTLIALGQLLPCKQSGCETQHVLQALERQWEAQSVDFAGYWLMKRLFWRWCRLHTQQAAATAEKLSAAATLAFQTTSSMVFMRWQQFVELQHERRRRLHNMFESIMIADESSMLRMCFERWQSYQRQGQLLSAKSNVVLQLSQQRVLQVSKLTALALYC